MLGGLMANARLLGWKEMDVDAKNSTGELVAYNTPVPDDTNGLVIYTPVTSVVGAPVAGPARILIAAGNCACRVGGMGNNHSKFNNGIKAAMLSVVDKSAIAIHSAVINLCTASYGEDNRQTKKPPQEAVDNQSLTAFWLFEHLKSEGVKAADEVVIVAGGAWTAEGGPLRPGLEALWQNLVDYGVHAVIADDVAYPTQADAGLAFTLAIESAVVKGFEVHVDAAALADMERAEEAARAHAAAMQAAGSSAGGKACMSGVHAARIQSAGGKATMSGVHAARISSAGGKAAMSGVHAARISSAGGKATMSGVHAARIQSAGGKATMSGVHAARVSSAGGKAGLGKIRKSKPNQTAKQKANAARMRLSRAAKRAAEAKVRVE